MQRIEPYFQTLFTNDEPEFFYLFWTDTKVWNECPVTQRVCYWLRKGSPKHDSDECRLRRLPKKETLCIVIYWCIATYSYVFVIPSIWRNDGYVVSSVLNSVRDSDMTTAGGKDTLLGKHHKEVQELLERGLKPKAIADTICAQNSLPPRTITAKQVSDYIAYHKKNNSINVPKVTGSGVAASWGDDCM